MAFFIALSDDASKFLEKLDKSLAMPIAKKIRRLENSPGQQGKPLGDGFFELKHLKFRIYYTVIAGEVLIERILYEGKVFVPRIGDKHSQHSDIKSLKR